MRRSWFAFVLSLSALLGVSANVRIVRADSAATLAAAGGTFQCDFGGRPAFEPIELLGITLPADRPFDEESGRVTGYSANYDYSRIEPAATTTFTAATPIYGDDDFAEVKPIEPSRGNTTRCGVDYGYECDLNYLFRADPTPAPAGSAPASATEETLEPIPTEAWLPPEPAEAQFDDFDPSWYNFEAAQRTARPLASLANLLPSFDVETLSCNVRTFAMSTAERIENELQELQAAVTPVDPTIVNGAIAGVFAAIEPETMSLVVDADQFACPLSADCEADHCYRAWVEREQYLAAEAEAAELAEAGAELDRTDATRATLRGLASMLQQAGQALQDASQEVAALADGDAMQARRPALER